MCNLMYTGPPIVLSVDQGTAYVSREMRENLSAEGVTIIEAPMETPGKIGVVERHHAPLRAVYVRIRSDLDRSMSYDGCAKMAFFSVNSTIRPEGLCPILLVYGVIPRPVRSTNCLTQLQRAHSIDGAMLEAEEEHSKRRLTFGLSQHPGPKGSDNPNDLSSLPEG